uniref:Uncharacterized protein n=1 Tax=Plectus sambesii TaxID=2011161 RepID=A0A914WLN2_9BILA
MGKRKCSTNKTTPTKKQEIKNPPEMKTTPFKQRIKLEKKAKQEQLTAAMATLTANNSIEEEELYAIRSGALVPVREQMLTHIRDSVKTKLNEQSRKDAQAMMLCRNEFKTAMDMSYRVEQIQQTFIRSLTDQVTMYRLAYTTLLASLSNDVVARIRPELIKKTMAQQRMACTSTDSHNRCEQLPDGENGHSRHQEELTSHDESLESLCSELKNVKAQCASLNEQLNAVKEENALLRTRYESAQGRQKEDLIQENKVLNEQNNGLLAQNRSLKEQLDRVGGVNQALTEVVRERDAARKLAMERERTIDQLTVEANVARAQINQLRLEKGHLNARNTYYEMTLGNKEWNMEEDPLVISMRETESLNSQLRATQETLKQRDAQMQEMMMYLDQIKAALPLNK